MTLNDWANLHRDDLLIESPDKNLIADLQAVTARELGDAETVASSDGRLGHIHAACLSIAAAALAASGYRIRKGSMAHHYLLIESLGYTLGLTSIQINELQNYRKKRSQSVYERTGVVTDTEASAALITARRLEERFATWLATEHPELRLE